jgi:hypothetical protein
VGALARLDVVRVLLLSLVTAAEACAAADRAATSAAVHNVRHRWSKRCRLIMDRWAVPLWLPICCPS